jgi:hypothetical protein
MSGAAFNCPGFDTWKYGLHDGPSYLGFTPFCHHAGDSLCLPPCNVSPWC